MLKKMELVNLYTKSGIFIGQKTKLTVTRDDYKRIFRVTDKNIRGLIYNRWGEELPSDYVIDTHHYNVDDPALANVESIIKTSAIKAIGLPVFVYGFNRVPGSFNSVWFQLFYQNVFFLSFVVRKEQYQKMKQSKKEKEV